VNTSGAAVNLCWSEILSPSIVPSDLVTLTLQTTTPIIADSPEELSLRSVLAPLQEALRAAPGSPRLQRALVLAMRFEASRGSPLDLEFEPAGDSADAWLLRFVSGHATAKDAPKLADLLVTGSRVSELGDILYRLQTSERSRDLFVPVVEAL